MHFNSVQHILMTILKCVRHTLSPEILVGQTFFAQNFSPKILVIGFHFIWSTKILVGFFVKDALKKYD